MSVRARLLSLLRTLVVFALAAAWLLIAAARGGYFDSPRPRPLAQQVRSHELRVLDGDTFLLRGQVVRLLGVDCAERAAPWFEGDQEPWAGQVRQLATERIERAVRIELLRSSEDDARGRLLAHVLLDGEPLAVALIEARLAWPTVDRFGDGGYPEIAAEILGRAKGRRPKFQQPWRWRRDHRRD